MVSFSVGRIGADGLSKERLAQLLHAQYPLFTRWMLDLLWLTSTQLLDGSSGRDHLGACLEVSEHVFAQVSVLLYVSFLCLSPS